MDKAELMRVARECGAEQDTYEPDLFVFRQSELVTFAVAVQAKALDEAHEECWWTRTVADIRAAIRALYPKQQEK